MGPALLLCLLAASPTPKATRGEVVILRASQPGERLLEATTRLAAELRASGFAVRERERDRQGKVLAYEAGAVMALDPAPLAAVSVFESDGELAAALWRVDKATGRPTAWRVSVKDEGAPGEKARSSPAAVLAIRTVELLLASLTGVELDVPKLFPPPPEPPPPVAVAVPAPRDRPGRVNAAVAGGLLQSLGGIGPSAAPVLRVGYSGQSWGARLGFVGFGTDASVTGSGGSARIGQDVLTGDLLRAFSPGTRLVPFASLGAGAIYTHVAGRAGADQTAASDAFWAALVSAGGGTAWWLSPRVAVSAELQALLAWPSLRVRLSGQEAARAGRPSLLLTLGVLARP